MSEPRKADGSIIVQIGDTPRQKFELFKSEQFTKADMQSQPQYDYLNTPTFRVRHNGQWLPPGDRRLMTMDQVMLLVEKTSRRQLQGK